jgi:hypothetical protein
MSNDLTGGAAEVVDLLSMTDVRRMLSGVGSAIDPPSNATSIRTEVVKIAAKTGNRLRMIGFAFKNAERVDGCPRPAKQSEFRLDFCREITRLEKWAADLNWRGIEIPELRVVVSDRFKISKSLVPAWSGRAGNMEFPSWRVIARKAAILHELVHVFFPNGNRFLAEGLATYLQAAMGGNPAFPNFGKPLHENVRERFLEMAPAISRGGNRSLEQIHLADLDAIPTPSPLTLQVGQEVYGEEPRGQAFIYPIAGSFVQFLIETRGIRKLRELYVQTPLVPLTQNAGSPDRWLEVYSVALADLESEWKSMLCSQTVTSTEETLSDRPIGSSEQVHFNRE